jgi:hypothetical protein
MDEFTSLRAGDRTRTGFLQLGRLMCNQLHLARERPIIDLVDAAANDLRG